MGEITKPARTTSTSFWYGLVGMTYVLTAIYLFYVSSQTGMSAIKNLAVAALLTIFFAADFFMLLAIARFVMRALKIKDN